MREKLRWFPTFVNWIGYNVTSIIIQHGARLDRRSGYSLKKLLKLALDVIILNSNKPLKLVVKFGFAISFISFLFAMITLYQYLRGDITVLGWTSLIIFVWLLSGIIIFIVGFIGLYICKIYEHSKYRPLYIIKEKTYKS